MTTDAGNVSVRHLRQTTCLEAEEAGSEFQEEIPGNLIGGNLDHPVLGKLVKYLKSQQRNPTNLTQWTAQVSNITTLVTSSQESTNRRMALRAQLPSGMGEGGERRTAQTLSQTNLGRCRCHTELTEASRRLQAARLRCRNSTLKTRKPEASDLRTKV